uniref:IQ motif, EF-hand binding site n=1 Tax=Tanacetum cinerariifolium TaxID=118510 RepID=A0A6L2KZB2_TANCI|nr:IQ motif, EF-hand binding site [Tanacetum cinerariifolium]
MGRKGSGSWFTAVKRAFSPHKSSKTQGGDEALDPKRSRWLFRKSSNNLVQQQTTQVKDKTSSNDVIIHVSQPNIDPVAEDEKRAILMAAATAKAAEAAATTAHAAAEIIRLTTHRPSSISVKYHIAAILIQTSFRGYLARRALRALKGIVMLQAVIRGQNVRKQATITLRCMQALIRVQTRIQDQRSRLSHDGGRKSTMSENTTFWESKHLQDIRQRKSMSRDGSCIPDDWSDRPQTLEELDAILQNRKMQLNNRNPSTTMDEQELEESASWLDRWIEAKQWEHQRNCNRTSLDRRDFIKTVEMDSSRPSSRSVPNYMAATESAKAKIRSQSTPRQRPGTPERERVGSVKKRLAYPVPDPCDNGSEAHYYDYGQSLKSPSIKSVQVGHVGMGQQWYYADSITGGEISPCSTTDLRKWLR